MSNPRFIPRSALAVTAALVLLAGCATGPDANPRDPLEPLNRGVYRFNDAVDRAVLKPVATAYVNVTPSPVRTGVNNFFGNLGDLWSAVNAGLPSARFLAGGARTALMVLFVAMALEHLGVGRQVLLASFTILFGGVVFALALAFGLGGRHLARRVLERAVRGPEAPRVPEQLHHL